MKKFSLILAFAGICLMTIFLYSKCSQPPDTKSQLKNPADTSQIVPKYPKIYLNADSLSQRVKNVVQFWQNDNFFMVSSSSANSIAILPVETEKTKKVGTQNIGKTPVAEVYISQREGYYLFERNKYIFKFDPQKIYPVNFNFCETVEKKRRNNGLLSSILESLHPSTNGIELDLTEPIKRLIFLITDLTVGAEKVEIFIRGYADKGGKKVIGKLDPAYLYDGFDYLPATDGIFKTYSLTPAKRWMLNKEYKNEDLPFLRGEFILENYIRPEYGKKVECAENIVHIYLLEGITYDEVDRDDRRVDIFMKIYAKE